jgi:hypothetical protein
MLLWPRLVCGATAVLRSSPGPRLPKPYGHRPLAAPGALLISPFNVKWRFSAPAGKAFHYVGGTFNLALNLKNKEEWWLCMKPGGI